MLPNVDHTSDFSRLHSLEPRGRGLAAALSGAFVMGVLVGAGSATIAFVVLIGGAW